MSRHGIEGIGSVTETLMRVIGLARSVSATASKRGGEAFWDDSSRNGLRYTLPLLYSATGKLTIPDTIRFITTAPTSHAQAESAQWQNASFFFRMLKLATGQPRVRMQEAALNNAVTFWREQWPAIPDKTRGNIVITITAALDRFNHGRLNRVFCGTTTVVPELAFCGAILVDAKPTLTCDADGTLAQKIFQYFFMRSVLSRNALEEKHRQRPLFIWNDEHQEVVQPYTHEFLALARESRCAFTALSQSLPAYVSKIGGDTPRESAQALASLFNTHIFFSNSCGETNEMAARILGKVVKRGGTYNEGMSRNINIGMSAGESENHGWSNNSGWGGSSGASGSTRSSNDGYGCTSGTASNWGENRGRSSGTTESRGYSEAMEYSIEPGDFARVLKNGGPQNNNTVTGVWFQTSRIFPETGTNWMTVKFKQS